MNRKVFAEKNKCCIIDWKANKIKRVVRSTLASEALAFQDGLEALVMYKKLILEIFDSISLPLIAKVDNKSLVVSLHSTHAVEEKLLRLNMASIKQLMEEHEINVSWIAGEFQLADCLTKRGASGEKLLAVMQSGALDVCYGI